MIKYGATLILITNMEHNYNYVILYTFLHMLSYHVGTVYDDHGGLRQRLPKYLSNSLKSHENNMTGFVEIIQCWCNNTYEY